MDDAQLLRYSRHILLSEFGYQAQEKLTRSRVLLIGMGGIGSPCSSYLVSSGVGKLIIAEFDKIELTNLARQILYRESDVDKDKAIIAQTRLLEINPNCQIEVFPNKVTSENINALLADVDLIIDATDRFSTRHLINSFAVKAQKTLLIGSAIRFDGQIFLLNPTNRDFVCYECIYPQNDGAREEKCAQMGVFAPAVGAMGIILAGEAIKYLTGLEVLENQLILFNFLNHQYQKLSVAKNPNCAVCGNCSK